MGKRLAWPSTRSSSILERVSADGGTPTVLTRPDRTRGESGHWWPEMLPNGQGVLYTVTPTTGGLSASSIAVLDLPSGRLTTLLRGGSHAQFGPVGYLVFAAGGTLRAVGFDPKHSIVAGPGSPLVSQVLRTATGAVEAALARGNAGLCGGRRGERLTPSTGRRRTRTAFTAAASISGCRRRNLSCSDITALRRW